MTFGEAGPVPAQGHIAQQAFWYTAFTADMTKPGLPVVNADGTPKWRMAPAPWPLPQGMQNGYQDVGSWTFFKDHDANKTAAAAWLYAQFTTSRTVSLKKSIVGLTFIRNSDIRHDYFTQNANKQRRPDRGSTAARAAWPGRPPATTCPTHPWLAGLWWTNIASAVTGERTPQQAMDNLAEEMDQVMEVAAGQRHAQVPSPGSTPADPNSG